MAVTLETIARKIGVSKVTVSLALRGSHRISDEIREKVVKAAEELGYTPNPMVSALMVSLRAHRRTGRVFNLCFLTAFPSRDGWKKLAVFHHYHDGALRRAEALGYGLEIHWARDPELSGPRLTQILEARGIPGILIAPLSSDAPRLSLDLSRFATVALGHTFKQVPTHRVTNHQFHTILTALEACLARGYRRIGLAATKASDARVNHIWLAGFLSFQATHPAVRKIAPFVGDPFNEESFLAWFRKTRPQVIVSPEIGALEWLRRSGRRVPEDVAFVHIDWIPERGDIAAVDQRPERIGEAAVDLLVEQINQNRRGSPAVPRTVLIEGVWRDGPTLPIRRAAAEAPPSG